MSTEAMLVVKFHCGINATEIIDCYIKNGLSVFSPQHKVHFVTSDDDSFDWEDLSITYDRLKEMVEYKQKNNFTIGLAFFEGDICITELLVTDHDSIILSCDINRKTINSSDRYKEFTDANWYIEKLVIPLKKVFAVLGFEFSEWR